MNNTGLISSRDKFVFDFDRNELLNRVRDFANSSIDHAKEFYGLRDVREKTLEESQRIVRGINDYESCL
jgi:hypothetical protein